MRAASETRLDFVLVGSMTHRSSTPTAAGAAGVRATRRLEGGRYRVVGFFASSDSRYART